MSTVADQVRTCIRRDPVLREGLARDILSHAKLARWLQATYGIPGTEHAVISALRRTDPMDEPSFTDRGREAIDDIAFRLEDQVSMIRVDAGPELLDRIGRFRTQFEDPLFEKIATSTATLAVPAETREDALDVLGRDVIETTEDDIALFILTPKPGRTVDFSDVWRFLDWRFTAEGITTTEHTIGDEACKFLVPKGQAEAVRDHLIDLKQGFG